MKYAGMKYRTFPDVRVQTMSDMPIVAGVLVGGWLDLKRSDGWLYCSDVFMRYSADTREIHIAMGTHLNRDLFMFTASKLHRKTTGDPLMPTTHYRIVNAESVELKTGTGAYHWIKWKLSTAAALALKEAAKDMTDNQKKTFFTIKEKLSS